MNFELTDEQNQLQDALERLLADHGSFGQRRTHAASEDGFSRDLWQRLGRLGVTALLAPEAHGGFGGTAVDLLPVMKAFGRALLLEPFLASSVLGATALRMAGDSAAQQRLLPRVASGESIVSWAHDEAGAHHAVAWIETRAVRRDAAWVIDGSKINVLHASAAQHLVVSARIAGDAGSADGRALFLVDPSAAGLQLRRHRLVDDTPAAEVGLQSVLGQPLGDPSNTPLQSSAIDAVLDTGMAAVCADMVGAMELAFRLAIDYLNTRRQFGRLIGENQALRHKAAEMLVSLEICRSMAIAAAVAVDNPDAEQSAADLMRAKLLIGRHARQLCHQAIQLHGGIGMTEEYAVGHCLRRVHVLDQLFGSSEAQAERLAAAL